MSRSWSFAFSWRWVGYLVVAIVFAVVCGFLSNWQVNRLQEKEQVQALVDSNWSADPVALDQIVPDRDSFDEAREYQPVTMTGEYLVDEQVLVRNRPRSGQPGFEVITPLELESGTIFMVDRGWVPTGNEQDRPDIIPAPPEGTVNVTARVKPGEPELPSRSASGDQIATVHLPDLASRVTGESYTGAYGLLVSEDPAPAKGRPLPAFEPEVNEGMHLSYAIQWVIFALLAFAFLVYAVRQEYQQRNADDPRVRESIIKRERKRREKQTDADIEDELLDSVR